MMRLRNRLLFILLLFVSQHAFAEPVTFTLCYEDKELLPYFAGQGQQTPEQAPGVSIEIIRLIDKRMPALNIHFLREPWKRCLANLSSGASDGVIASYRPEREKIGVYPKFNGKIDLHRAFEISAYCFFTVADNPFYWDGESFQGNQLLPVAFPLGYSIGKLLRQHKVQTIEVVSSERALFLMANNRVSGAATLCRVGERLIRRDPQSYGNLSSEPLPLEVKGAYIMVSRRFYRAHPELTEALWDAQAEVIEAHYEGLYAKYATTP